MNKFKMDYLQYFATNPTGLNYLFIDPPWNYGMDKLKLQEAKRIRTCAIMTAGATNFSYWGKNNQKELEGMINLVPDSVDVMLIWTTNPMLEATMRAVFNSKQFRFRSLLTWEKTTVNDKQSSVMAHYFQNCTEFLVFVVRKRPNNKINRIMLPTHFSAIRGKRTVKPKDVEREIMTRLGGRGAYVFCGNDIDIFNELDIDVVDICL